MAKLIDAIAGRRSARSFVARPVEADIVASLIEAFRWAPSATNKQPWRLLVVDSPEGHQAFDAALSEANRQWAPQAPLKLVVIGNPTEQDRDFGQERWLLDCGLALGQLLIQACGVGLNVRSMAGFDEAKARSGFAIPDPYRVVAFVACGYPGRVDDLAVPVQIKERRPRARKASGEIVYRNRFGEAWSLDGR